MGEGLARFAGPVAAAGLLALITAGIVPDLAEAAGSSTAAAGPGKPSYAERYGAVCAVCHGVDGRSDRPEVPVLAGQHSFYAITQLFMFREGRRADPGMTAIAREMNDADMRGFAQFISTLAAVPAPPSPDPADPERMKRGAALAKEHKCIFCHGDDFSGGKQVPRIGGQHEGYLRTALREFREGRRPGYTMAMSEALGPVAPEDLDTLAYYLARFGM